MLHFHRNSFPAKIAQGALRRQQLESLNRNIRLKQKLVLHFRQIDPVDADHFAVFFIGCIIKHCIAAQMRLRKVVSLCHDLICSIQHIHLQDLRRSFRAVFSIHNIGISAIAA